MRLHDLRHSDRQNAELEARLQAQLEARTRSLELKLSFLLLALVLVVLEMEIRFFGNFVFDVYGEGEARKGVESR